MKKRLFFSIMAVAGISAFTFAGTYAYFIASTSENFTVETEEGVHSVVKLDNVVVADQLIPISDDLVKDAIVKDSDKCIDSNGYEVCSLYKVTLTNSGTQEELYGYIRTGKTTYATDNLMYQVFSDTYEALSDANSLSRINDGIVYFQKDGGNYLTTSNGSITYYIALWLTETGVSQKTDYGKNFSGFVGFEAARSVLNGARRIEATFDA